MAGFLTNKPADQVIAAQYIGYFGRAPDPEGFQYWALQYANAVNGGVDPNTELVLIANQFVPQPETLALFPFLALSGPIDPNNPTDVAGVQALIGEVYLNLFDRTVSQAELQGTTGAGYWVQQILHGQLAIGDAIIAIENGAVGPDAVILQNKITAADYFVEHTAAAGMTQTPPGVLFLQEAHAVVKFIDGTQESVTEAEKATDAFVANGGTEFTGPGANGVDGPAITLTTAQDTLTGFGHDVFNAPLSTTISGNPPTQIPTLQTGDSLIDISPDTGNVLNATFNPAETGEFVTNTTTLTESLTITESFVLTLAKTFFGEDDAHTFAVSFGIAISDSISKSESVSFTQPITGVNYVNATIEGIGTWNLTATSPNTVTAINGGPNVTGVNDIEMINSSGGFFDIGSTTGLPSGGNNFQPLQALVATISATNDTGGNKFWLSGIDVSQQESLFTPTTSVQINLSNAGSGPPATDDNFTQDKVRGIDQSLFIGDGPTLGSGPLGVVTWNILSDGTFNSVFLETNGTVSATTINITGPGALVAFGDAPEFMFVTTIAGGGTSGGITITGFLNGSGGLLADNNVLTSFTGGSGNDFLDASGFSAAHLSSLAAGAFDGGGGINEVVLANDILTSGSPLTFLANFTIIGDAGDNGPSAAPAGTIDFANLPAGANELIFFGDLDFSTGGLVINNAPATFTVNFQNFDFNDNAITIHGPDNASVNNLTIEVGCNLDGSSAHGLGGPWVVTNYDNIDIQVIGHSFIGTHDGDSGFIATPAAGSGVTGVTLTLTGVGGSSIDDHGNVTTFDHNLFMGNFDQAELTDIGNATSGGVALNGGIIIDDLGGSFTIGVTDASVIDARGATVNADGDGGVFMENPDSNTITLTVWGASGTGIDNELQGSLGPILAGSDGGFDGTLTNVDDINDNAYVGQAGPATINGGSDAGDYILDTGGAETINLHNASGTDHVEYSMFDFNSEGYPFFALAITNDSGDYSFDGHTGPGLATINGFVVAGSTPDHLTFNVNSWGFGNGADFGPGTYFGLTQSNGGENSPEQGAAVSLTVFSSGTVFETNGSGNAFDLLLYGGEPAQTTFANAGALETALNNGGGFAFQHDFSNNTWSFLIAYGNTSGGVNIADVQFHNAGNNTVIQVDHAVDLATLNNVTLSELAAAQTASAPGGTTLDPIHFITSFH